MNSNTESYFSQKIISIILSGAIIAINCVLSIPLFPNERSGDWVSGIFGNLTILITDCLLVKELWNAGILKDVHNASLTKIKKWIHICAKSNVATQNAQNQNIGRTTIVENSKKQEMEPGNYLAWRYIAFHVWRIINETVFIFTLAACFNGFGFLADLCKLLLAVLVLISVAFKDRITVQSEYSYFTWSIAGATCFSSAFSYIVEEVIWAYIELIEKSIEDPHYGLDIPGNITTVEEYIEPLFKLKATCLEHSIGTRWGIINYILELIPFSTEYFSFATFFCFLTWRNLSYAVKKTVDPTASPNAVPRESRQFQPNGHRRASFPLDKKSENNHVNCSEVDLVVNLDHTDIGNLSTVTTEGQIITEDPIATLLPPVTVSLPNCWFILKCFGILLLIAIKICFVAAVFVCLNHRYDTVAIWLFYGHRICFQIVGGLIQLHLFTQHLEHLPPMPTPPNKFQLDIILLIFPLVPLAIIFTLNACPDILNLTPAYLNPRILQTLWNILLASVTWVLYAYQVLFITRVFRRLHHQICQHINWFHLLVVINLCIWISWAIECKSVTLHVGPSKIFGVVNWTVLIYSTVPFVLFGFAHSAACFWEIAHHLSVET